MNTLTIAAAITLLGMLGFRAGAESDTDQWQKTYTFGASPLLEIDNIWGDIHIRGVPGRTLSVSVHERRSAGDAKALERSRELIFLDVRESATGVAFVVDGSVRNWRGHNPCHSCRAEYRFEVEAPYDTRLEVGTVNDGEVRIQGIRGTISAGNVNGSISALDMASCERISTVNGDIRAGFSVAPARDCAFDTVNGDIITALPPGAGLDLALQLANGRVYSQFEVEQVALAPKVERSESSGGRRYRIEQPAGLRIGGGGPVFTFESLNGDVRIELSKQRNHP